MPTTAEAKEVGEDASIDDDEEDGADDDNHGDQRGLKSEVIKMEVAPVESIH